MKMAKIYEVGDRVSLELTIAKVEIDDRGQLKYTLKDERSKRLLDWGYHEEDLTPTGKSSTKSKAKPKTSTPAATKKTTVKKNG